MIRVLFVCHGNICRSPMAEMVFKDMVAREGLKDKFYIYSSATSYEEIGSGVHRGTRAILQEKGVPCEDHRANALSRTDYESYDYIIGMDCYNIKNMYRILGEDKEHKIYKMLDFAGIDRDVADPWYTRNFDVTYHDILLGCRAFLDKLKKEGLI